jgi:hypothetical protein
MNVFSHYPYHRITSNNGKLYDVRQNPFYYDDEIQKCSSAVDNITT